MTPRSADQLAAIASYADALPVAIWVGKVPGGECVYVNREFERMLGITPPEGASRGNYVGPYGVHLPTGEPYPEDKMPYEQALRAGKAVVVEDVVVHRHDGTKAYLRVFVSPLRDEAGNITHIVEAFTDKTREVENERALMSAQRLESVGALAAGVAHDFNNLLGIVKLVATNLREHEKHPTRLELIRHLDEVSESAQRLTRSLLSFARRGKSAKDPVQLNDVIKGAASVVSRALEGRVTIQTELDPAAAVVQGDATQLERVVLNLLMNARDAIPASGKIWVRTSRLQLEENAHPILAAGTYVSLDVEDTGAGVDPAVRERIFEPYVTTKNAGTLKGTGMGLAAVYAIARGHGGHAEILATGPGGTTMRVYIPASA